MRQRDGEVNYKLVNHVYSVLKPKTSFSKKTDIADTGASSRYLQVDITHNIALSQKVPIGVK